MHLSFIVTRNTAGKRPFQEPRHRWADNIKMVLKGIACLGVNWRNNLAQDRVQLGGDRTNTVMYLRVLYKAGL